MCTGSFALVAKDDKAGGDKSAATASHADKMMASCIAVGNQEEIALAEFARQKTHNDDVKKFVEMMITDHHTFLLKLRKFAPEATQPGYIDTDAKVSRGKEGKNKEGKDKDTVQQVGAVEAADDAKQVETADASSAKNDAHGDMNFEKMGRELAAECLAQSKEKLGKKEGAEFDLCFMGQQMAMHEGMKVKLIVFQRHASGELAKVLAEGQKTTEHHIAKAEHILKDLTPTIIEKGREGKNRDRKVTKEKGPLNDKDRDAKEADAKESDAKDADKKPE